jgi:hypothetical protein
MRLHRCRTSGPVGPVLTGLLLLTSALALPGATVQAGGFEAGLDLGYSGGLGGQVTGTFRNFTRDVPLSLRLSLGYFLREPGDPYAARSIFINDNTNGTPEKSGGMWQLRFDLTYPIGSLGKVPLLVFGGVRHAGYTAHFEFVGGNEVWDVTANPWGLGAGLETAFAVGDRSFFVITLGVDRYFDTTLSGHDTSYSPDGNHVNPRNDYTYEDAKAAINPPGWEAVALVGVRFVF